MPDDATLVRIFVLGYIAFGILFSAVTCRPFIDSIVAELGDTSTHPGFKLGAVAAMASGLVIAGILSTFGWMPYLTWYLIAMLNGDESSV